MKITIKRSCQLLSIHWKVDSEEYDVLKLKTKRNFLLEYIWFLFTIIGQFTSWIVLSSKSWRKNSNKLTIFRFCLMFSFKSWFLFVMWLSLNSTILFRVLFALQSLWYNICCSRLLRPVKRFQNQLKFNLKDATEYSRYWLSRGIKIEIGIVGEVDLSLSSLLQWEAEGCLTKD